MPTATCFTVMAVKGCRWDAIGEVLRRKSDLGWAVGHIELPFACQTQLHVRLLPDGLTTSEVSEGRALRQIHAHV